MNAAAEIVPLETPREVAQEPCSGCKGKRRIWSHQVRKRIDCPHCTGIGTAEAQRALADLMLTGAEKRRVDQARRMIDAAVAEAILETRNPATIKNPAARAVNRIMERWAVGHGTGLPPDDAGALKARPPRLDDATQCVIDDIVNRAPQVTRRLLVQWYRSETPVKTMANQRRVSVGALYFVWHATLEYLDTMFRASKYPDLLRMLKLVDV